MLTLPWPHGALFMAGPMYHGVDLYSSQVRQCEGNLEKHPTWVPLEKPNFWRNPKYSEPVVIENEGEVFSLGKRRLQTVKNIQAEHAAF